MIFIFIVILTYFSYRILSKKIKNKIACILAAYFISAIIVLFFTFKICSDGWISNSIGVQGACSHHGGVATKLNSVGVALFFLCLFVFIFHVLVKIKKIKIKKIQSSNHLKQFYALDCTDAHGKTDACDEKENSGFGNLFQTSSRELEKEIKEYCSENNISYVLNHKINKGDILACFEFKTKNALDAVVEIARKR